MSANKNLRAILVMVTAAALFTLMDAGMKLLSQYYPPMQVTALRSLASLPFVYFYVIWRSSYTIFYVAPLLITALSVPILGEKVGTARWIAIGTGLTGVLIVLRPTGAGVFTLAGLAVIASALCYTFSAIIIRILGRTDSMESLMFWLITMLAAGSTLFALPQWLPIRPQDAWLIAGIGLTGFCGQWGVTYAFRHGEVSAIAPFEYTGMIWSLGLDRLIWRTSPDRYTLIGAAIIIGSGLFLVRRERVHAEAEHP
jgi:drug/metabolite transporter (DMT)-like permease